MNDKAKVIIAAVCLAVAGAAVAWQMGLFSPGPEGAANSDEFDQSLEDARSDAEGTQTTGGATIIPPSQSNPRGGIVITN